MTTAEETELQALQADVRTSCATVCIASCCTCDDRVRAAAQRLPTHAGTVYGYKMQAADAATQTPRPPWAGGTNMEYAMGLRCGLPGI